MSKPRLPASLLLLSLSIACPGAAGPPNTLQELNRAMFRELQEVHNLSDQQMGAIEAIFSRSGYAGQGNPAISEHPETPRQCKVKLEQQGISYASTAFEATCHDKYMAPLYDPSRERPEDAHACIDQFEFPDVPCSYPVVWVRAREAAEVCAAEGKRLCDAHEWEGACAGQLEPPDYRFDLSPGVSPEVAVARMRAAHNRVHESEKSWSYGPKYEAGVCATGSHKTPGCPGGSWTQCGSNTYPAGDFPDCKSPLQVYDLNGNAAEHMNLPLTESQMSSRGSQELGFTEMKGSWFSFDSDRAHQDWCRWRAPFWHGTRVMASDSHANYHLGFRCCKTVAH